MVLYWGAKEKKGTGNLIYKDIVYIADSYRQELQYDTMDIRSARKRKSKSFPRTRIGSTDTETYPRNHDKIPDPPFRKNLFVL